MKINSISSVLYEDFYPFHNLLEKGVKAYQDIKSLSVITNPGQIEIGTALLVWGGQDISPALYNRKRSKWSGASNAPSRRDIIEWECIHEAIHKGVPIIGICRGAQMLCAAAGGILMQHVENHAIGRMHDIETSEGETLRVNSLHHQMMYPFEVDHEMLAWAKSPLSDVYFDGDEELGFIEKEPELVVFDKIRGIAAQWHPEMMQEDAAATDYLFKVINSKLESW